MLYGLALPEYSAVKDLEGQGPYAVDKYYKFPFNLFYAYKLRMIVNLLPKKIVRNILDFGAGTAEIFTPELKKHALRVVSIDSKEQFDLRWKFDVIVCASSLEFMYLKTTVAALKCVIADKGELIVASPMNTLLTRLYFKIIGDEKERHSPQVIMEALEKHFTITEKKTWLGLYFAVKAVPK